jgi:putative spermidine/putrescine transport system permease protein
MSKIRWSRIFRNIPIYLIFGFIILPVVMVIWISFFSGQLIVFPPEGYSLKWYKELPEQSQFLSAFFLSLKVSFFAMILALILGMICSLALIRYEFKGKKLFELIFLSPLIVPSIITGIAIYIFLFNTQRWINVGLVPSIWSLTLAHVIISLPWTVRLISAGLMGLNKSIEEAAIDLGSNKIQTFWYITLPSLRPSLIAAGILAFIHSFNNLEISLMLVRPGETTLPIEILNYVYWKIDPLIAAVSTVQIILIGILMWIVDRVIGLGKSF